MIELTFLKLVISIRQVDQKSVLFVTTAFWDKGLKFWPTVCNSCQDVLMMSMNLNNIAILNIDGVDYFGIINGTKKSESINLFKNADF